MDWSNSMKDTGFRIICLLFTLCLLLFVPCIYAKRKPSVDRFSTDVLRRFNSKQFLHLMEESPRDHAAVTLFILDQGCDICPIFQAEFERVAQASSNAMRSPRTQQKNVQFYVVQLSNDQHTRKLIDSLQIRFVPLLYVFQPEQKTSWPRALPEHSADLYVLNRDTLNAQAVADFVRERTGLSLQLPRRVVERLSALDMVVTLAALLFVLAFVSWMLGIIFHPLFWSILAISIFCASVSGIHYSIQHQRPWIRKRAVGLSKYIIQGSWREQLASEGAIFSSLCFFLSLSVVLLGWLLDVYQSVSKSRQKWIVLLSYLTCGVLAFILFLMKGLWDFKFPGYLIFSQE